MTATLSHTQRVPWHGRHLTIRRAGSGPTVLLIHGMAGSLQTWDPVVPALAATCDVIAVDLPGHGDSCRLRGDYSLGALASALRDVLEVLDVDGATIVGHSLGGGIAMQFAYQFPERCDRLVLVSSGGLGREVTPFLRVLALPGADLALAGLTRLQRNQRIAGVGNRLKPVAGRVWNDLPYMLRQMAELDDPETRRSFLSTVRAVIDVTGQSISATDRLYLAQHLPTMIVWGGRDRMIPVSHGLAAAETIPNSRLEIIPFAGHYPHEDEPERFVRALAGFITSTQPARITSRDIRRLIDVDTGTVTVKSG